MEGSVKNLLEAEQEAKQIVEEASEKRKMLLQDAGVHAAQEINAMRSKWDDKLSQDAERVSICFR